jgi:hypothetical protein
VRRGQRVGNVGAGAEAGKDEAARFEIGERRVVGRSPLGLDQRRPIPLQAEPAQVLHDPVDELGAAARRVEILDPQQELAAARARPFVPEHRAERVAEV